SMKQTIEETQRRREAQEKFNEENGITPEQIIKKITTIDIGKKTEKKRKNGSAGIKGKDIDELKIEMSEAAAALEFERAAVIRDRIQQLQGK
ncbi:MAG: UvrB/UvrC motif-containing protein, partial [Fibrobacterota bacterium]